MKLRSMAAAVAMVALTLTSWNKAAFAQEGGAGASCMNDIDCKANGTTCGTDVCDFGAAMAMTCVPAAKASGMPGQQGWCSANTDCKCMGEGATCMAPYCTFIAPRADAGGGGSSSSSGGTGSSSSSSSGGSSSSGAASGDASTTSSSGGGSSGGCSLAPVAPAAAVGWGLGAASLGLAFMRRRQRKMS